MNNNNEITSTEKFTGTMDVQDKLKFPEKKLEEISIQKFQEIFYVNTILPSLIACLLYTSPSPRDRG